MSRFRCVVMFVVVVVSACSSDPGPTLAQAGAAIDATVEPAALPTSTPTETIVFGDRFPEVLAVEATSQGAEAWTFSVTMSSPYDTPERYADAWRVLDADGNELGVRVLLHDHASEQPFTRSTSVEVPSAVDLVFVEGRDQLNGWSGQRFAVDLSR